MPYSDRTLDDRARLLLKTLIERYIEDGQPVGSRTLSRTSGLELSPATIRNVMADLEALGLIASPHTSAGRVPTARGYRLFVDTMLTAHGERLQTPEIAADQPHKVIAHAAKTLSELSQYVGVVLTPRRSAIFRQIEFVRLSEKRVLLIIVTPEGEVQNSVLFTDDAFSEAELTAAANYLNAHYAGRDLTQVRAQLRSEIDSLREKVAKLMKAAVQAGSEALSETAPEVVISGTGNLLAVRDFSADMQQLRRAFELFEQKAQLIRLLECSDHAAGVRIFIGGENHEDGVAGDLSAVSAPYRINGKIVGRLGVIGPTRMPYHKMIQIVDITSRLMGHALSDDGGE